MTIDRRTTPARGRATAALLLCGLACGLGGGAVLAEDAACRTTALDAPARQVLRCPGVTVTAEADAEYSLVDRDGDGIPDAVRLDRGGALIEVAAPRARRPFTVRTPHAVATVRGTAWATDVTLAQTSVLVTRGVVAVARGAGGSGVRLRRGEGVDVAGPPPDAPLVRRQWPEARAAALLARFGR